MIVLIITYISIAIDDSTHRCILYRRVTFKVPPNMIPINKKTGFNNFDEKDKLNLVNEIKRLIPNAPNNHGKGKLIITPI